MMQCARCRLPIPDRLQRTEWGFLKDAVQSVGKTVQNVSKAVKDNIDKHAKNVSKAVKNIGSVLGAKPSIRWEGDEAMCVGIAAKAFETIVPAFKDHEKNLVHALTNTVNLMNGFAQIAQNMNASLIYKVVVLNMKRYVNVLQGFTHCSDMQRKEIENVFESYISYVMTQKGYNWGKEGGYGVAVYRKALAGYDEAAYEKAEREFRAALAAGQRRKGPAKT